MAQRTFSRLDYTRRKYVRFPTADLVHSLTRPGDNVTGLTIFRFRNCKPCLNRTP